jgi:DNA-binding CsgD family transcriptional regulator
MMDSDALMGLPAFLQLLSDRPNPNAIISVLLAGPLADFDARAGILLQADDASLALIGAVGYGPADVAGFETIPIADDLPICLAYREAEVIVTPALEALTQYTGFGDNSDRWSDMRARMPLGSIVAAPAVSEGVAVGAYGFTCAVEREWSSLDIALLDAVSSALGIWMAHPDSGFATGVGRAPVCVPALTPRQCDILALVQCGWTNAEIGGQLGYSESTVKQEVQRATRILDASDRMAAARRARELGLLGEPRT